jgi:hypothetical protein
VALLLKLMTEMRQRILPQDTTAILKQINSLRVTGLADYQSMPVTSVLPEAAIGFGKPYIDDGDIRTFDINKGQDEYVWHRDKEDRHIEVIEGAGWRFQPQGCLPFLLQAGLEFNIKKNEYHRLIKGETDLKIRITKLL